MKAPRGQIPYIDLDGNIIPDSELAYNTCIEKGLVECLDRKAGLNEKETAICRSLRSLIERDLLDILLYERQVHIRALIAFAESSQLDRKLVPHKRQLSGGYSCSHSCSRCALICLQKSEKSYLYCSIR
jgi:hypothetical protein